MIRTTWISTACLVLLSGGELNPLAWAQPASPQPEHSRWQGFERLDFRVDGRSCLLVQPATPGPEKPWIWRTEFFGHEPQGDLALLEKGFHVAYMDLQNLYGAPVALDHMDQFYSFLTNRFGLGARPVLEGFSRGGLFAFNWAARHPKWVSCLYVDAPVCDFKSWPAGWGRGQGSPSDWMRCKEVYGLTDKQARAYQLNPVDNLAPLAAERIPILSVCGDADDVVPFDENTKLVQERYSRLGGPITVVIKPAVHHHPHSLKDPTRIVAFILRATSGQPLAPGELSGTVRLPDCPESQEARLQWWRAAKFGLFIHWGPASVNGTEISWSRMGHPFDHPGNETVPAAKYDKLYLQFDPVRFNAGTWMHLARDAGMKYVVFVTKHHDGFSMWPTRLRPDYSIAATPFHRDICGEIATAAREQGLKLGWYYSTRDWTHPDYLKGDNERYNRFYEGQIKELLSNYGKVDILWFDHVAGNWRDYHFKELFDEIYQIQPQILVNNRAARFIRPTDDRPTPELATLVRGDFDTPEQRVGTFQSDRPWEACVTMTECSDGGGWSYRPDGRTRTFEECIRLLVNCVTGDGNLLLNVGPLPTGEIDPHQVSVLERMGAWLNHFGESIYATRGGPFRNGPWGGSTYKDNSIYLHVFPSTHDKLQLPPLKGKVLRAAALTGGTVEVVQTSQGLSVTLPTDHKDEVDTVIKLDLDRSAKGEFLSGQPLAAAE